MCGCTPAIEQPGLSKQQRTRINAGHFPSCRCRRAYPIERFRIAQKSAGAVAARNDQQVDGRRCVEAVARRQLQIAVAAMGSSFLATVKTRKGAVASDLRDSMPGTSLVREKTSKGPAKSSTSTPSNNRIPTLCLSRAGRDLESEVFATFMAALIPD